MPEDLEQAESSMRPQDMEQVESTLRRGIGRTFRGAIREAFLHYSRDRWRRALLGTEFEDPLEIRFEVRMSEELAQQARDLYFAERERAAETRRRSDQLLTRILGVSPFIVAVTVVSTREWGEWTAKAGAVLAACAALCLILSFLAVRNNLGREVHYAPISVTDLFSADEVRAMDRETEVTEHLRAFLDSETRNDDSIDRQHFAFGMWVWSVLLVLLAGACALVALVT